MMINGFTCPFCWRQIPIPTEEIGYNGIKTQILETKRELEIVFGNISQDEWGWNNPAQVWKAFQDSNFDENTENIAILRDVRGSISTWVYLKTPIYNPLTQTLVCNVQVVDYGGLGLTAMAYNGFAIAYNKEKIKTVTWNGKVVPHLFENKNNNNDKKENTNTDNDNNKMY